MCEEAVIDITVYIPFHYICTQCEGITRDDHMYQKISIYERKPTNSATLTPQPPTAHVISEGYYSYICFADKECKPYLEIAQQICCSYVYAYTYNIERWRWYFFFFYFSH